MRTDLFRSLCVLLGLAVWSFGRTAWTEPSSEDAWSFIEAWRGFRMDLDSTIPDQPGHPLVIHHLGEAPAWLVRDGLRLTTRPEVFEALAERAVANRDRRAIPILREKASSRTAPRLRIRAQQALARSGDAETLQQLEQNLARTGRQDRLRTARMLLEAGAEGRAILESALAGPDRDSQLAAASALVRQGHRRAKRLLKQWMQETTHPFRLAAAQALARTGDAATLPLLREALQRRLGDRIEVVRALGFVGQESDLAATRRLLRDPMLERYADFREACTQALGRIAVRLYPERNLVVRRRNVDLSAEAFTRTEDWLGAVGQALAEGRGGNGAQMVARLEGWTPVSDVADVVPTPELAAPPEAHEANSTGDEEPGSRQRRFRTAVERLTQLSRRLDYPSLADPPEVATVGLGSERAVDGNYQTAWVASPVAGSLRLELDSPKHLAELWLVAGCVDSRESYAAHGRARLVEIRTDDRPPWTVTLADNWPFFQRIALPRPATKTVALRVVDTYPGQQRNAPPCIAEIRLVTRQPTR